MLNEDLLWHATWDLGLDLKRRDGELEDLRPWAIAAQKKRSQVSSIIHSMKLVLQGDAC